MKKFKGFIILLFIAMFTYSLYSCTKPGLIELEAPLNLRLEGRVLYWDKVDYASSYIVAFQDQEFNTTENYYSLTSITEPNIYQIDVLSVGDGITYTDSIWTTYSYNCEEIVLSGYDEENYYYTLLEDGSGYELNRGYAFNGDEEKIVLPSYFKGLPIKNIAYCAFTNDDYRAHPDPFREAYCNSTVKEIIFPSKLEYIGNVAFSGFLALKEITFPDSVIEIGTACFYGCKNLEKVNFPKELRIIGSRAFALCGLNSLELPDKLETIGDHAFQNNVTDEIFSNMFVTINNQNYKDLIIPASVKYIGIGSFSGCQKLENLTLINQDFSKVYFGTSAFSDTAYINNQNQSDYIYLDSQKTILYNYRGKEKNIVLPNSIKYLCSYAFAFNEDITDISLPTGTFFCGIGIFDYCKNLSQVTLPSDLEIIPEKLLAHCLSLKTINIPNSVTAIELGAFMDSGLEEIILPENLISIDSSAFICTNIESCIIPNSVEYIGERLFYDCENLKSVTLSNKLSIIPRETFNNCSSLVEVNNTDSIIVIDIEAFIDCTSLTSISFPKATTLLTYSFARCTSLEEITLPLITSIDQYTFDKSPNLKNVYLLCSEADWRKYSYAIYQTVDKPFLDANIYTYSEESPINTGNYWHYVQNKPVIWEQ